jgi:transposase
MPGYLQDWVFGNDSWHRLGSNKTFRIEDIDDSEDNNIYYKSRTVKEKDLTDQLIVTYSPKYKRYLRAIREKQIMRAHNKMKNSKSLKNRGQNDPKRFISSVHCTKEGEIAAHEVLAIDKERINYEEAFDGYYAVRTNLEAEPWEIVKINKSRWEIEQSFRIMKSEFNARPVFLSRDDRILAHFLTCFISLLIYRILEQRLYSNFKDKIQSTESVIKVLRNMDFYKLNGEGYVPIYTRTDETDALHQLFGFRTDTEIVTKRDMKKIINKTK